MGYAEKIIYCELEDIVGVDNITNKEADLDAVSLDVCGIARYWIASEEEPIKPNFLVLPETTEQVSKILKLANVYKIPVFPRGGGAGDTLGALSVYGGGIMLNMSKMNKVVSINENNYSVTAQTGMFQSELEEALNKKGYTLNFFPASHFCSELGGFIANRGSGTLSSKYGKIDNLILAMQVVLPDGTVFNSIPLPDHSSGPDLTRLFLGSEGTLGVITNATLKMYPIPEERRFNSFLFTRLEDAINAGREIMINRLGPSLIRVYDEEDTKFWVRKVWGIEKIGSYMIIGYDGYSDVIDVLEQKTFKVIAKYGGENMGRDPANTWWNTRWNSYYPPYSLESFQVLHGVIDTMATFENILKVFHEQKSEIESTFRKWGVKYMAHFSHWYEYGTIIYPTFIIENPPKEVDELLRLNHQIWNVGVNVSLRNGGSINEHHGIGFRLARFMKDSYGEGFSVLKNIKKALDPNNIMNPGKMGFERR